MSGILTEQEKAYCLGLEALKEKDFATADRYFRACGDLHRDSRGYQIIAQATAILAFIAEEKLRQRKIESKIKEIKENGEETVVRGEGLEEETC